MDKMTERITGPLQAFKILRLRKKTENLPPHLSTAVRRYLWGMASSREPSSEGALTGWHGSHAPHFGMEVRVWVAVTIRDSYHLRRAERYGGFWFIAGQMRIEGVL